MTSTSLKSVYTSFYKHCSISTALALHVHMVVLFHQEHSGRVHYCLQVSRTNHVRLINWSCFSFNCRINNSTALNVTWGNDSSSRLLIFDDYMENDVQCWNVQSNWWFWWAIWDTSHCNWLPNLIMLKMNLNHTQKMRKVFLCLFISSSFVNFIHFLSS